MKFPYTKFREHLFSGELTTILRPVLPLGVRYKGRLLPALYAALLDSGADDCIFHAEIGEALGMDVRSGAAKTYGGVGFGELAGYLHQIEIQIGGHWVACEVALTYGMLRDHPGLPGKKQGFRYGILGQRSFFEQFKVIFDFSAEEIELRPKSSTILKLN